MKSSITTTSRAGVFKRRFPLVIRTRKTRSPASKPTPRNERPPRFVEPGRTFWLRRSCPLTAKYSILVLLSVLTSVKTAPNPSTVAPVEVPGTKKSTSVMLLSKAVKSRWGLKVLKSWGNWSWMLPNLTGVFVGLTLLALTRKAVPGVKKTAPRGELRLKKLAGNSFGSAKAAGPPSQLISRRPSGNEPATLGFRAPRKARKSSTASWISAGLAPDASKTTDAATVIVGNESTTINNPRSGTAAFFSISVPPAVAIFTPAAGLLVG